MIKIRAKFPSAIFGLLKYSCALSFNAKVTEKVGRNSFFENDYLHNLFFNDRFPMAFTICKPSASVIFNPVLYFYRDRSKLLLVGSLFW